MLPKEQVEHPKDKNLECWLLSRLESVLTEVYLEETVESIELNIITDKNDALNKHFICNLTVQISFVDV